MQQLFSGLRSATNIRRSKSCDSLNQSQICPLLAVMIGKPGKSIANIAAPYDISLSSGRLDKPVLSYCLNLPPQNLVFNDFHSHLLSKMVLKLKKIKDMFQTTSYLLCKTMKFWRFLCVQKNSTRCLTFEIISLK